MSTSTEHESKSETRIASRVLQEGFGALAFWRPAHHAGQIQLIKRLHES